MHIPDVALHTLPTTLSQHDSRGLMGRRIHQDGIIHITLNQETHFTANEGRQRTCDHVIHGFYHIPHQTEAAG